MADAIVVADYGRGITANTDIRAALSEAVLRLPVVWDPHPAGSEPVEGVAVVTPNLVEALASAKAGGWSRPAQVPKKPADTCVKNGEVLQFW